MLLHAPTFIAAKILTRDLKIRQKESIYIVIAILIYAIVEIIPLIHTMSIELVVLLPLVPFILLFIYFLKIKHYPYKKSFTLMTIAVMIATVVNLLVILAISAISASYFEIINSLTLQSPLYLVLQTTPFLLVFNIITALITLLFVKLSRGLRERVNRSEKTQTVLAIISGAVIVFMTISTTIMQYQNEFLDFIVSWELFFAFALSIVVFMSFNFYVRSEREKIARQQKETEQEALQYYTNQLEQQQLDVQKFKHDQQNMLISMKGYLETENLVGLKNYFYSQIARETEAITQSDFQLKSLCKIKIQEIKTILATKLFAAKNMNIAVELQVVEDIDYIPGDSIVLVRMLGIILDNAIEALIELQSGTLLVACYKDKGNIVFVVQNTCSPNLPPLSQLNQLGYSTKGDDRGLGLNNLYELIDAHPSIVLQTNITDGNIIQKLSIGE